MELNFTVSKEELLNFHMNHITETKDYKYAIIGNTIFLILFLLLLIIIFRHTFLFIPVIIEWIVLLAFRKKYILYGIKKRLRKIFSYEKYKGYFETTKLIIREEGLNLTNNLSQKTYKWVSIRDIYLIDNYIFIRTITHDDILVPINSFVSSEDKELFIISITKNTTLQIKNKYPIDFKYQ